MLSLQVWQRPNDPQAPDYAGYESWLTKLNQLNGNMVKAFTSAGEYQQRFGPLSLQFYLRLRFP